MWFNLTSRRAADRIIIRETQEIANTRVISPTTEVPKTGTTDREIMAMVSKARVAQEPTRETISSSSLTLILKSIGTIKAVATKEAPTTRINQAEAAIMAITEVAPTIKGKMTG